MAVRVCCDVAVQECFYASALEVRSEIINYAGKVFNPNVSIGRDFK